MKKVIGIEGVNKVASLLLQGGATDWGSLEFYITSKSFFSPYTMFVNARVGRSVKMTIYREALMNDSRMMILAICSITKCRWFKLHISSIF